MVVVGEIVVDEGDFFGEIGIICFDYDIGIVFVDDNVFVRFVEVDWYGN